MALGSTLFGRVLASTTTLAVMSCASRFSGTGGGSTPAPSNRTAWAALSAPTEQAETGGVVALRPPLEGRVPIPGGSFVMGSTPEDIRRAETLCHAEPLGSHCDDQAAKARFVAEMPAHEVTLSPYAIDRTEVTVGAYGRCVANGACPPPEPPGDKAPESRPELPVTFVEWEAAVAYCTWAGGRLPTEAEWEFAARGAEERTYPWGNVYNPYLCNHGSFAADPTDASDGFYRLAPVGSFPDGASPLGLFDMAGNVSEWVSDTFDVDAKGFGYTPSAQVNPKGPPSGPVHVIRGGDYADGAPFVRATARDPALGPSPTVGFRCAADLR
jgi:formylglycine-generating enzyme